MADTENTQSIENLANNSHLAKERLIWAIKPFGLMAILLWVFDPSTAERLNGQAYPLMAFVLGVLYGLVVYWDDIRRLVIDRMMNVGRDQRSRIPEEYYWGEVESELARWK